MQQSERSSLLVSKSMDIQSPKLGHKILTMQHRGFLESQNRNTLVFLYKTSRRNNHMKNFLKHQNILFIYILYYIF